MTKADLVDQVSEAIGPGVTKRDCALVVDALFEAMKHALIRGEHIELRGFGTFKVQERNPRTARNPRSGETVLVPARVQPVFKPARGFRDEVNEALGG